LDLLPVVRTEVEAMTRKRHMILRPQLIAEMRAAEMRGNVAAAKAMSLPFHRARAREDAFDQAAAAYGRADELARLAGVVERSLRVGETCK
jgi:hypothetical protein